MSTTDPVTVQLGPEDLRQRVSGEVLGPADPRYDAAHQGYYGGLRRQPAAVVRPADVHDVAAVVSLARDAGAELAVRSGGHGLAGHSSSDGGVVLDLSSLDTLDVDVEGRTAWAGAGLTAGAYSRAAGAHGLATGFGDAGSVGLGGLTVGGGIGFLSRKHGLTIDSLLAAQVVTADGYVRHVDAGCHPELFWGIRGGGGNLGIVTRLRFALHDVAESTGGMLVLPADPEVLAGLVAVADAAPDELTMIANTMTAPPMPGLPAELHGRLVTLVLALYVGPDEAAQAALAPLRALAEPLVDGLAPIAYADLLAEEGPAGDRRPLVEVRNLYRDRFTVDEARTVLDGVRSATSPMAAVQVRVLGGAIARIPDDATAYAHRQRRLMLNVAAMFERPEDRPVHVAWAERLAAALHEDGVDGAYVNFIGDEGPHRVGAAYPGPTLVRLAELKRHYDPSNLFRRNHNVRPA